MLLLLTKLTRSNNDIHDAPSSFHKKYDACTHKYDESEIYITSDWIATVEPVITFLNDSHTSSFITLKSGENYLVKEDPVFIEKAINK